MLENESLPRRAPLKPFASWILFCTDACTGDTRFYLKPNEPPQRQHHSCCPTSEENAEREACNWICFRRHWRRTRRSRRRRAIAIITAAVQSLYNLCWLPYGITTAVHAAHWLKQNLASVFLRLFNLASPAILRRLFPRCRPLHELTQRITNHSHFLCLTPFLTKAPSLNDTWFTHICHTLFVIPRL